MRKYHNKKTEVDGILFDSRKEADYYIKLKARLRTGQISNLQLQVPFELLPSIWKDELKHLKTKDKIVRKCMQKAVNYIADFVYTDNSTGAEVVVDVKGVKTKEYRLKKKMMLALKGIEITEV